MTIGKFCSVICCCKMYSLLNPTKLNVLAEGNLHQNSKRKYNIYSLTCQTSCDFSNTKETVTNFHA